MRPIQEMSSYEFIDPADQVKGTKLLILLVGGQWKNFQVDRVGWEEGECGVIAYLKDKEVIRFSDDISYLLVDNSFVEAITNQERWDDATESLEAKMKAGALYQAKSQELIELIQQYGPQGPNKLASGSDTHATKPTSEETNAFEKLMRQMMGDDPIGGEKN